MHAECLSRAKDTVVVEAWLFCHMLAMGPACASMGHERRTLPTFRRVHDNHQITRYRRGLPITWEQCPKANVVR